MFPLKRISIYIFIIGTLILNTELAFTQKSTGILQGEVVDEAGGIIIGATVTIINENGKEKTVITSDTGKYSFNGLEPGKYSIKVIAPGFAQYENRSINIAPGKHALLNIRLVVTLETEEVVVSSEEPLSTDLNSSLNTLILREEDLDKLPDDTEQIVSMLRAMAGGSSDPEEQSGGVKVDGFSSGKLPPKEAIREIRINQNPYSAENDRMGWSSIDILTKPGMGKFSGRAAVYFNDESLNARNPFASNKPSKQSRYYSGSLGGPIIHKRVSFFINFDKDENDLNKIVNATILDSNLHPTQYNVALLAPQRSLNFSIRPDLKIDDRHTLIGRYSFSRTSNKNVGIGDFSLPSRAYETFNTVHDIQLTETAIINKSIVTETRLQYVFSRREQHGDNSIPSIHVQDAFNGGGSQIGLGSDDENRWEAQNYTMMVIDQHSVKFGLRLRGIKNQTISSRNFGGTFSFSGGTGPMLDANNEIIRDGNGTPLVGTITSIERYRRTLLFQQLSPTEIRVLGGGASQFSIAGGNPEQSVSQMDFGSFINDEWKIRQNFSLGLGLRYETQTNIDRGLNFAPRVAFAWSPGGSQKEGDKNRSKLVIRGGAGIFYERIRENYILEAKRYNSNNQSQFIIFNPDFYPNIPSIADLTSFAVPQTIRRLDGEIQAPYTIQSSIKVERALPLNLKFSTEYRNSRTVHALRSRNINAPIPGTYIPGVPASGIRPLGNIGNVYQYESTGIINSHEIFNYISGNIGQRLSFGLGGGFRRSKGDTDGAYSFPSDQYNMRWDYGRTYHPSRYMNLWNSFDAPFGINIYNYMYISSGRPFNITIGSDLNGDSLFTERPTFATDLNRPGVVVTRFGAFNTNPQPGERSIPRNYGTGPVYIMSYLSISKTFAFGDMPAKPVPPSQSKDGKPANTETPKKEKRYSLTWEVDIDNPLNHPNRNNPVGNISSPYFGQAPNGYGFFGSNRQISTSLRFKF
jgi:hypothetical protein